MRPGPHLSHYALMPQLREDQALLRMDPVDHRSPSCERGLTVHVRQICFVQPRIAQRGRVVNSNPFGDEQTRFALRPAPVVGRHVGARNSKG